MIEYYLHTGIRSTGENYNNFGNINNGIGSISSEDILSNSIRINGQTLLETLPQVTVVGQVEIITNSGEFFLSGFSLRDGTGFLNFNDYENNNLKFDIVESGSHSFYYSSDPTGLITGFSGQAGDLSNKEVFLNGIKMVSGSNYELNQNNNFLWIDDTGVTGVLFSMPKQNQYYNTGIYDPSGISFNRGTTVAYLNGVKVDEEDFLETSSIVGNLIESGLNAKVEFNKKPPTTTVYL